MRPVLVTRVEPGASQAVALLQRRSIKALNAATANILFLEDRLDLQKYSGLVFTSVNGVRAYSRISKAFDLPVYCVGDATGKLAQSFGFKTCHCADGDGADLADLIGRLKPEGRLLHIRGQDIGFDLEAALTARGIDIHSVVLYRAVIVQRLSPPVMTALKNDPIVLIYSKLGAERFLELAGDAPLSRMSFIAISRQATSPLEKCAVGELVISAQSHQDSMFEALQRLLDAA